MASDPIVGAVKLSGLLDLECFETFPEFVQALIKSMVIELPDTTQGVVVSQTEPTSPTLAGIWIKIDASGSFLGMYVFSNGAWIQIDLGACAAPSSSSGSLMVCNGGIGTTLSGAVGKIPVVTSSNIVTMETPFNDTIGGILYDEDLGGQLSFLVPSQMSTAQLITVSNSSTVRNKVVGCVATLTVSGDVNVPTSDDNSFMVGSQIEVSLDNVSFSPLINTNHIFTYNGGITFTPRQSFQIVFSGPLTTIMSPIPAGGSQNLYFRSLLTWVDSSAGSSGSLLDPHISLNVLLTGLNV